MDRVDASDGSAADRATKEQVFDSQDADDYTRMRDLGVNQIQGYLFGRPMTFERASELVHGIQQRLSA